MAGALRLLRSQAILPSFPSSCSHRPSFATHTSRAAAATLTSPSLPSRTSRAARRRLPRRPPRKSPPAQKRKRTSGGARGGTWRSQSSTTWCWRSSPLRSSCTRSCSCLGTMCLGAAQTGSRAERKRARAEWWGRVGVGKQCSVIMVTSTLNTHCRAPTAAPGRYSRYRR